MGRTYDMRLFFHGETDDTIKVSVDGDVDKGVLATKIPNRLLLTII